MADKGLSEYTEDYCLTRCDFNLCKDRNCDSVKWLKKNIPEIKLQTLEDVWKAMKCDCLHTTVWCANSSPCKVCSLENCPLIKNLREAL